MHAIRRVALLAVIPLASAGFLVAAAPADAASGEPDCAAAGDGVYPSGTLVAQYYVCAKGVAYPQNCPAALAFDPARLTCDWPESAAEAQFWANEDAAYASAADR